MIVLDYQPLQEPYHILLALVACRLHDSILDVHEFSSACLPHAP